MKSLMSNQLISIIKEHGLPKIEEVKCEKCKKHNTYEVKDDGSKELILPCDCHFQETFKQDLKRKKQRIINYYFNQSIVNPELKKASFEKSDIDKNTPNLSENVRNAYKVASDYCRTFSKENTKSIIIQGDTGTGKSFLAYSMARYIKDKGFTVLFIDNVELLSIIKASFNKKNDTTEEDLMRLISEVDLLVLDDVGANKNTDWASEKLYEITNKRQGTNTIYTTNLDLFKEAPADIMLKRSYSRINNGAVLLKLDGEDRRLK